MKPAKCGGCPLQAALGPCWGTGPKDAKMVLVGEAPGPDEVQAAPSAPFVGRAGWLLDVGLKAAGVSRRMCYVTNTVKCLPYKEWGNDKTAFRKPTQAEVEFCAGRWLAEELAGANVVVALGDTAAAWLTRGHRLAVDGKERKITEWRGVVLDVQREVQDE